jgi:secondary thiamine-phosphate synthase enzyme
MTFSAERIVIRELSIATRQQGLHDITREVEAAVADAAIDDGLCTLFVQHTSASLTIQENADPSARADLEKWLNRLVPEHDPHFTHTQEGPDDMPSHIKSALTATSLVIPVVRGHLALGTWQGIYLWEHRRMGQQRRLVVHIGA